MKIELTDLFKTLELTPAVLSIDGNDYSVRDLAISEVRQLDAFATMNDADGAAFAATLFNGDVPPDVDRLRESLAAGDVRPFGERQRLFKRVNLIVSAVTLAVAKMSSPEALAAAIEEVGRRVKPDNAAE